MYIVFGVHVIFFFMHSAESIGSRSDEDWNSGAMLEHVGTAKR